MNADARDQKESLILKSASSGANVHSEAEICGVCGDFALETWVIGSVEPTEGTDTSFVPRAWVLAWISAACHPVTPVAVDSEALLSSFSQRE
jgi:hypothetical protein